MTYVLRLAFLRRWLCRDSSIFDFEGEVGRIGMYFRCRDEVMSNGALVQCSHSTWGAIARPLGRMGNRMGIQVVVPAKVKHTAIMRTVSYSRDAVSQK